MTSAAASLLSAGLCAQAAVPPGLLSPEKASAKAPPRFTVRFATTQGTILVRVHRDWAPLGADRFFNLVKAGFYNDAAFFRVLPGFVAQFGINGSPEVSAKWKEAVIKDDPPSGHTNARGTLTFATAGPGTRTTQLFINYGDNARLDAMGFTPFGEVLSGMEAADRFYSGYGEGAPQGQGPEQNRIEGEGDAYLKKGFPKLDYIRTATIVR